MDPNPYAPPATSEPGEPAAQPTHRHQPGRKLWPLFLITLLQSAVTRFWIAGRMALAEQRLGMESAAMVLGYSSLAGGLGAIPVALLGDGGVARLLMLVGLLLMLAATLLSLLPSSLPLAAVLAVAWYAGDRLCGLLVVSALLRGVTVRGAYLALLLFEVAGRIGHSVSNLVQHEPNVLLLLGAVCAALALAPVLKLAPWGSLTVPDEVADPLGRDALARGRALGLVSTLAAVLGLASVLELHGSHSAYNGLFGVDPAQLLLAAAGLLGLLLPIVAFLRRWRPRPLVVTGAVTTTAAGLLLGGARVSGSSREIYSLAGTGLLAVGRRVLLTTAVPALIRQNLPATRMGRWYAIYDLCWTALRLALLLPTSWLGAPGPITLAASLLTIPVIFGLSWLTWGR